jgi:hypothetical protein
MIAMAGWVFVPKFALGVAPKVENSVRGDGGWSTIAAFRRALEIRKRPENGIGNK